MTVKAFCTRGVVYPEGNGVHDVYMAKKVPPKVVSRLRPLYQRTFIRDWRKFRELSQEELAEKVGEYLEERGIKEKGYSYASIGRIETGKMPYSQPVMEAIADALEVTVETLIARPPPSSPDAPNPDEVAQAWRVGNLDDQEFLVDVARRIKKERTGTM
jgi:transcriptional regulator with XRE-family HTH domain